MNTQLRCSELNAFETILPPDGTAQDAIAVLKDQNGDIEASFKDFAILDIKVEMLNSLPTLRLNSSVVKIWAITQYTRTTPQAPNLP